LPGRKEIEDKLRRHKPVLHERFGVERIGLFGSYAKGKETPTSDVDIFVQFGRPIGWEFIDLKDYLEDVLGKRVDLVTEGALKPQLKDAILSEVVYQ